MPILSLGTSPQTLKSCDLHNHDSWEIVINTVGTGEAVINGKIYPFAPGKITCIPPHLLHIKTSKEGFYDLYFHTNSFPKINGIDVPDDCPLIFDDDAEKSFESLVRLMLNIYYHGGNNSTSVVSSLHDAAIQILTGRLTEDKTDPIISQIQNKMIASFTDPEVNLTSILKETGYAEDYIRRKFRKETAMTPGEYLTQLRVGYAKQLILQKTLLKLSFSDISLMCGYYDEQYFSRVFRQQTGLSPRDYMANPPKISPQKNENE